MEMQEFPEGKLYLIDFMDSSGKKQQFLPVDGQDIYTSNTAPFIMNYITRHEILFSR